jgi:hypothetical protein
MVGNVKTRLHRARQVLRTHLEMIFAKNGDKKKRTNLAEEGGKEYDHAEQTKRRYRGPRSYTKRSAKCPSRLFTRSVFLSSMAGAVIVKI